MKNDHNDVRNKVLEVLEILNAEYYFDPAEYIYQFKSVLW